jgi:hypothetical protein
MRTWQELLDEIYTLTNRPDLVSETNLALRQAVRSAHKSGKYWRDLVEVDVVISVDQIQTIDLTLFAPRFRGLAYLRPTEYPDLRLDETEITGLLDGDNYAKVNVYWGFGSQLKIRAANPTASYTLAYYQYPVVTPVLAFNSWIAEDHDDLLILWAAMTVLGMIGESEIRGRLEQLATVALANLQQDNVEITAR